MCSVLYDCIPAMSKYLNKSLSCYLKTKRVQEYIFSSGMLLLFILRDVKIAAKTISITYIKRWEYTLIGEKIERPK